MDVIESAFSDGADANTKLEAELASDRNAAVSVIYPEQAKIGRMLSTPEGAPSPLFRGLQLLVVATAVGLIAIAPDALAVAAGMGRPNELLRLVGVLCGVGLALCLLPLNSARVALQPGGALERLRAGEQKIGEADAGGLGRWRVGLAVLSTVFVLFGLLSLVVGGILGVDLATGGTLPPQGRALSALLGLFLIAVAPVIYSGWWPAMATACCLCRDNVTETIRKVRDADPADDSEDPQAWLDNVATPALALRGPMDELSDSLGPGLLGLSGGLLSVGLGSFTLAVNAEVCDGFDARNGAPPPRPAPCATFGSDTPCSAPCSRCCSRRTRPRPPPAATCSWPSSTQRASGLGTSTTKRSTGSRSGCSG